MSSSSHVRVLSVFGVWLGLLAGCGGNPEVAEPGNTAGTSSGGTAGTGTGGNDLVISMGGDGSGGGEGDPGTAICGNQALEPGEVCDDGNTAEADGCSADCSEVDLDYDCSSIGDGCVKVVICGNGVLEGSELCDDGNSEAGDGCAADCKTVEGGFACIRPSKPCVPVSECGNGVRERGEECDDQVNLSPMAGDGCDEKCQLEAGYDCPPGAACVQRVCGNGVRTPDEACDDDNMASGDGCSSACAVESGWRCNANGCLPICGDGLVRTPEQCDDSDRDSGDGCSAACTEEPFFNCTGQPSACVSSISCGNSVVEPGEICDPPGTNGCKAGCKSVTPVAATAVCGNSVIELNETCDPPMVGSGCDAACKVQAGWTCPQPGVCFRNPFCGDSIVQAGEECDPPKLNQGCSAACQEESGYTCVGLGPSTCVKPACGNGTVEPGEQCDDNANTNAADGCHNCVLATGWVCPAPDAPCIPRCGDGLKRGIEECDDGDITSGDGCNAGCKVEPGFACPAQGNCTLAVCGNNVIEGGEGCDDNNKIAGDGCGPTCQPEPTVTVGPDPRVNVFCGDGLKTGTEECDDGNVDPGDGCDDLCEVELPGWTCSGQTTLPPSIEMSVTYRDFKSGNALTAGGHPDFQYETLDEFRGIAGPACTSANAANCGELDANGKPKLVIDNRNETGILSAETFKLWFRSTNPDATEGENGPIQITPFTRTLTLAQQGGSTSETYSYANGNFFPLGEDEGYGNIGDEVALCDNGNGVRNLRDLDTACHGCDATCRSRNFGFTSELRYFFQYKGGEALTFQGDDDVWVFINGGLAVDLGGLHSQKFGRVVLGDDGTGGGVDSNCTVHSADTLPALGGCLSTAELNDTADSRFGLVKGGVYEIVLFHAERHSNASNFRLTLAGFLAPRSFCETVCSDGIVVGDEYCDDGANNSNTIAGRCNTSCTARSFCGDSVRQTGEVCDNGTNTDLYRTAGTPATACAPGCKALASCGDAVLQAAFEDCDKGNANDDASYGATSCKTNCKLGGYCGDGAKNGTEGCDLGTNNGKTYGASSCGYDCKPGARCGDSILNGNELCDDGSTNGTAGSNCTATCTIKPYCGDGLINGAEKCDNAQFSSDTAYGGCTNKCEFGPLCGDGTPDDPYEECDDGTLANTGSYDGCTNKCDFGPRCGDAEVQAGDGEICDNGFNDDIYKENATSCGPLCMPPAYCGDGTVQSGFELCDAGSANNDDTYEGCSTSCDWGPFCGDGTIDASGSEKCDDGLDNVPYAPESGGCSYECDAAPYCGDGVRNGPEQCDLPGGNNGDYGTCNTDCTLAARCGDKVKQGTEECDDGPSGSPDCTLACKRRQVAK